MRTLRYDEKENNAKCVKIDAKYNHIYDLMACIEYENSDVDTLGLE